MKLFLQYLNKSNQFLFSQSRVQKCRSLTCHCSTVKQENTRFKIQQNMKQLMYMLNSATNAKYEKPPFRCGQKNMETYTPIKLQWHWTLGAKVQCSMYS